VADPEYKIEDGTKKVNGEGGGDGMNNFVKNICTKDSFAGVRLVKGAAAHVRNL